MRTLGLIIFSCVYLFIKCEKDGKQICVESCKEGEQESFGEHCYFWSTEWAWWHGAKSVCEGMNGTLASITSMEIHKFLMKKVDKGKSLTWYWIGGSDREKDGVWKWEDGRDWDFTNSRV